MAVRFVREESGQSTTEYVLLLLFVVIAVKAVGGGLKDKLENIVNKAFSTATDQIE
jgi:Flp pilus assembly pilin Flp